MGKFLLNVFSCTVLILCFLSRVTTADFFCADTHDKICSLVRNHTLNSGSFLEECKEIPPVRGESDYDP